MHCNAMQMLLNTSTKQEWERKNRRQKMYLGWIAGYLTLQTIDNLKSFHGLASSGQIVTTGISAFVPTNTSKIISQDNSGAKPFVISIVYKPLQEDPRFLLFVRKNWEEIIMQIGWKIRVHWNSSHFWLIMPIVHKLNGQVGWQGCLQLQRIKINFKHTLS